MMDIVDDPTKILDEVFMMTMFSKYLNNLPPFQKYWDHLFEKKQMVVVAFESGVWGEGASVCRIEEGAVSSKRPNKCSY
jgi:hypothetical protein